MCKSRTSYRFALGAFRASRVVHDFTQSAMDNAARALRRKATAFAIKHNTGRKPAAFFIGDGTETINMLRLA